MITAIALAAVLTLMQIDPVVAARLEPFNRAVAAAKLEQANLKTLSSDRDRLLVMRRLDQASLHDGVDRSGLSPDQGRALQAEIGQGVLAINAANVAALLTLVPAEGWFSSKTYGQEAATGAFLIIQHSNPDLQRRFLPAIEAMVAKDEALGSEYALMYDRIAVAESRLQRYGTQMHCVGGQMVPQPTEAPEQLEARRAPMGFRWPNYAGYLANFGACDG